MPKKHRLTGAQIRSIRSSRRIHGTYLSLALSPATGTLAVCACVVSKKVALSAVVRNRIKRRCRAALQSRIGKLPAGAYIFHAKRDAAHATYADITADIVRILGRT